MKKIILIVCCLCVLMCGCSSIAETERVNEKEANTSMFVVVETTNTWKVVYHKETKVMYAVNDYSHGRGIFTLLVNPDGTPMLYGGAR